MYELQVTLKALVMCLAASPTVVAEAKEANLAFPNPAAARISHPIPESPCGTSSAKKFSCCAKQAAPEPE
jgi:hypothetical protein